MTLCFKNQHRFLQVFQFHSNLKTDNKLPKSSNNLVCGKPLFLGQYMLQHKQPMYPKVKVRVQEQVREQEDHVSPQNDQKTLLLTKVSNDSVTPQEKKIQSCSPPPLIARTIKAKLREQPISASKVSRTVEKSKPPGKATKLDVRPCSILRPRAVLSSPENDGMIGSRNKLIDKNSSLPFKVHNTKERAHVPHARSPQHQPKIAQSPAKKAARPMNMANGANKALINNNGVVCKVNSENPKKAKQTLG